jgi:hypothetical protein
MALNHKFTLLCDDARLEASGQVTIVGAYSNFIPVVQMPARFRDGLVILQCWEFDAPGQFHFKLRIQHVKSGKSFFEGRASIDASGPGIEFMPLRSDPLEFTALGKYKLILDIEGQRASVVVEFEVIQVAPDEQFTNSSLSMSSSGVH